MKKIKPDEFFSKGMFEVARFGNMVETKNCINEEQHKLFVKELANKHEDIKREIDSLVEDIRKKVVMSNPLMLMNYLTSMNYLIMINKLSESQFTGDENMQLRCVEYVQSVLVSSSSVEEVADKDSQEKLYGEIMALTTELYSKMPQYYLAWSCVAESDGENTIDEQEYIVGTQLMAQVRGTQYQEFRIPILKELLEPHRLEIEEAYQISLEELIEGLSTMERNLSSGRMDAFKKLREQMDMLEQFENSDPTEEYLLQSRKIVMQAIGVDLFDIKQNTNWPDILIDDLSFSIGEDCTFFDGEIYSGWPLRNMPVERKPFIKIDGVAYCFDYYILFDYFYRAFQRGVVQRTGGGISRWSSIQSHSSELIVGNIFGKLLPGCEVHQNNYYPFERKDSTENDLLISYKDVLIIVEVKAGAFTYTPSILDLEAHKKSIDTLVKKAEEQCLRTRNYIESNESACFYTGDNLKEISFDISAKNYTQIYMFDVTIADFNNLSAQMEKVKIADAKEDIIAISLNDLWVYMEYFDSPIEFIHYLSQRVRATHSKSLCLADELDHLGLYIDSNMYTKSVEPFDETYNVAFFDGYREEIDEYFAKRHLGVPTEKPIQERPQEYADIISICLGKSGKVTHFTNFIMDLSGEMKKNFADSIFNLSRRERELGRMIPAICFGEVSYALTVRIPKVKPLTRDYLRKYVLATLAKNGNPYCYLIEIELNGNSQICGIEYEYLTKDDIPIDKFEELYALGVEYAKKREQSFLIQNNKKKIYPNDPCPCGSGKKYKKCCGK